MQKNKSIIFVTLLVSVLQQAGYCKDKLTSTLKVATVNANKVLEGYPEAQKMLQDLSKAEAELNKKITAKREALEQAKVAKKTETEMQMLREQIRLEIEPEARKLEEDSNKRSAQIESNIDSAINLIVTEQGYDLVMMQDAVLYGAIDITDSVLQKLGK